MLLAVTGVIELLKDHVPVLSLSVLYLQRSAPTSKTPKPTSANCRVHAMLLPDR